MEFFLDMRGLLCCGLELGRRCLVGSWMVGYGGEERGLGKG